MDDTKLQQIIIRAQSEYVVDALETQIRDYATKIYRENEALLRAQGVCGVAASFVFKSDIPSIINDTKNVHQ